LFDETIYREVAYLSSAGKLGVKCAEPLLQPIFGHHLERKPSENKPT